MGGEEVVAVAADQRGDGIETEGGEGDFVIADAAVEQGGEIAGAECPGS